MGNTCATDGTVVAVDEDKDVKSSNSKRPSTDAEKDAEDIDTVDTVDMSPHEKAHVKSRAWETRKERRCTVNSSKKYSTLHRQHAKPRHHQPKKSSSSGGALPTQAELVVETYEPDGLSARSRLNFKTQCLVIEKQQERAMQTDDVDGARRSSASSSLSSSNSSLSLPISSMPPDSDWLDDVHHKKHHLLSSYSSSPLSSSLSPPNPRASGRRRQRHADRSPSSRQALQRSTSSLSSTSSTSFRRREPKPKFEFVDACTSLLGDRNHHDSMTSITHNADDDYLSQATLLPSG